jgi:hypothetical protein
MQIPPQPPSKHTATPKKKESVEKEIEAKETQIVGRYRAPPGFWSSTDEMYHGDSYAG